MYFVVEFCICMSKDRETQRGIKQINRVLNAFIHCHFVNLKLHKVLINIIKSMQFSQVRAANFGPFLDSLTRVIKIQADSAGICRLISYTDRSQTLTQISRCLFLFFQSLRQYDTTICKKTRSEALTLQTAPPFQLIPNQARKTFMGWGWGGQVLMNRDSGGRNCADCWSSCT